MISLKIFLITILAVCSANARISGRIFMGNNVRSMKQFPYQIGLSCGGWCGGSLLSNKWVVTAAHCVDGCTEGNVYLGGLHMGINSELFEGITIPITKDDIKIHKDYKSYTNDIALIEIPPVEFTDKIQPISMIPYPYSNRTFFDNQIVTTSGWGALSNRVFGDAKVLQFAEVRVASEEDCKRDFGPFASIITPQHICSSGEVAKGVCAGDSGGPMTARVNGETYLIGIAAFINGEGCEAAKARAFTRVSAYNHWIYENTNREVW